MKRALVTGAAGFIGSNITHVLNDLGYEIYALIEKGDNSSKEKLYSINSKIGIYEDLDDLIANAAQIEPFTHIFHLATVGVRPDFNDIELICDVNIKMGCKLVDFAKRNKSGLIINFGSCFEYGDHGDVLLKEDMVCYPESLYAISKNASTNLVTGYARNQDISLITVRPFGVFGNGEGLNRLAPSIISSCLHGEEVKTTEGNQIRDFVDVKDVAKSIVALANANYTVYEVYNICSNNPVKVRDFITEIIETCGFDISLIKFGTLPYRQNEAMIFAGDNHKLQELINYPFPNNHKDGIMEIYNSLKGIN